MRSHIVAIFLKPTVQDVSNFTWWTVAEKTDRGTIWFQLSTKHSSLVSAINPFFDVVDSVNPPPVLGFMPMSTMNIEQ